MRVKNAVQNVAGSSTTDTISHQLSPILYLSDRRSGWPATIITLTCIMHVVAVKSRRNTVHLTRRDDQPRH